MDEIQYAFGDGPCLDAARTHKTNCVRDVRQEGHRWPEYRAAIAHHGLLSILAVPVRLDGDTSAAINLYSTTPNAFTSEAVSAAEAFADQASAALRLAVRIAYLSDTSDNLRTALESRTVIDLAAGIIMAQNRCPQATATRILKSASSTRNIKMRDVATAVVSSVADEPTHTHFDQ